MEKLKKYSINELLKNSFILLITIILVGVIYAFIIFSIGDYHSGLLMDFIIKFFLDRLLFFMPAFFITVLAYTVNTSFSSDEARQYKTNHAVLFIEYSLVYIFITIVLVGLLSSTLMHKEETFQIKEKYLKFKDRSMNTVKAWIREADDHIADKKYIEASEKLHEVLLLLPEYRDAEDRVGYITEELSKKHIKRLKEIKKQGLALFNNKNYRNAVSIFHSYLQLNPEDREVLKYRNLAAQMTNLSERQIMKDQYSYKIKLNKDIEAFINNNKRIHKIINRGKKELKRKNFKKAKDEFKKVLKFDISNFEAMHYLKKANQEIKEIRYFTNRADKLIKKDLFYVNSNYRIKIKELRKAKNNDYIFYRTTFENKKTRRKRIYKYGYQDKKHKGFVFYNDLKRNASFRMDDINPEMIWYYKDLIESPEKFSLSTLFNPFIKSFRKYCVEVLKDRQLFFRVLMIKINYFVLTLFLMINFIILFFYMRKRGEQKKAGLYKFIFLPITAILINIVFIHLFKILKKALVIGSSGYLYLTIINLAYYVFLFILFFILFRLLYFEEEEIKVEGKKKKKKPLGAAPAGNQAGTGPRGTQTP